jgi:RES domain-containing protein
VVPIGRYRGRAWRQTALRVPGCLPPAQPATHAGRFHRPGDPWPLYASLDRETMWAERTNASEAVLPPTEDRRWVCTFDADLAVLDLRDPATRRALRVSLAQLTGPWSPEAPNAAALRVASAARRLGVDGLLIPSAARPGGWNLAVLPTSFERLRLVRRRRETPPA